MELIVSNEISHAFHHIAQGDNKNGHQISEVFKTLEISDYRLNGAWIPDAKLRNQDQR